MKIRSYRDDPDFGRVYDWEHESTPVAGIMGRPFVNFTPHYDWDWNRMDEEICLCLARTPLDKLPTVQGVMPPALQESEIDAQYENEVMWNYAGDREKFAGMDAQQKRRYMFYRHRALIPWYFILDLKPNVFLTKTQDLYPWAPVSDQMPYTRSCIQQLPFSEIGRVVIYGSWPEARVPCHRDQIPSAAFDTHINFNPGGYRPVYVYDSQQDRKHYLPSDHRIYAYNTTDYHGVDPLPYFSYTVRVDGIYNDDAWKIINS